MNSKLLILITIFVYVNCDVKSCIFRGQCDDRRFCIEEFDPIELKDEYLKSFTMLCPYLSKKDGPTTCCDLKDLKRITNFTYKSIQDFNNPCLKALNQLICHVNCNQNQRKYIRILEKSKSKSDLHQAEIISVTVNIEDMNKIYAICSNSFAPTNKDEKEFYKFMKSINNTIEFVKELRDSFASRVFFNLNDNGNLTRITYDSIVKVIGSVPEPLEFDFNAN